MTIERKIEPDTAPANNVPMAPEDELGVETSLATRSDMAVGSVSGEFTSGDFRVPRLETAYGVGKFVGKFSPGDLVLGGDNLLVRINEPLTVVILSASQYWKEYITPDQWAAQIKPRTFLTEQEVHAEKGTTVWGANGEKPTFSKAMDLRLLIRKPEAVTCGLFGLEIANGFWTPAIWSVDKSGYRRVGTAVLSAAAFSLKARGLLSGLFEIKNTVEKINGKPTVVPNIRLAASNSDELVAAIKQVFGAKA